MLTTVLRRVETAMSVQHRRITHQLDALNQGALLVMSVTPTEATLMVMVVQINHSAVPVATVQTLVTLQQFFALVQTTALLFYTTKIATQVTKGLKRVETGLPRAALHMSLL